MLLRVVLGEPGRLRNWPRIQQAVSSELIRLECFRTLDRARLAGRLDDDEVTDSRNAIDEILASFDKIAVSRRILLAAAEPLPVTLGSLDAIHLVSARWLRSRIPELRFATHDIELARAAKSLGFSLAG